MNITMNNGIDPRTGSRLGLETGPVENFTTFADFMGAFKEQMVYFLGLTAERNNVEMCAATELYSDPVRSSLMLNGIREGKDFLERRMPFENGAAINSVGMINVADSLAAIKKLVFDEKIITLKQLQEALASNWEGYEDIRQKCLAAPKYGNDDDYVDSIAKDLYQFFADTVVTFDTSFGGKHQPTAISITSHWAGALTGATPDGRYSGESLADGTISPVQGRDTRGPTALLKSAMKINQVPFSATLLNMKFHPSALNSTEDLKKLAILIKTYFEFGGKHVQFNIVDSKTLQDAQRHPEKHRDLIVRVAGFSAYFVQLDKAVQDEIIARTEHQL